jgi:hypothetical protein
MLNLSILMIILPPNVTRKKFKRFYVKSYREPYLGVRNCGCLCSTKLGASVDIQESFVSDSEV